MKFIRSLLVLLAVSPPALAQIASLRGQVTDQNGAFKFTVNPPAILVHDLEDLQGCYDFRLIPESSHHSDTDGCEHGRQRVAGNVGLQGVQLSDRRAEHPLLEEDVGQ